MIGGIVTEGIEKRTVLRRALHALLTIAPIFAMVSAISGVVFSGLSFLGWATLKYYEDDIWGYVRSASGIERLEDQMRSLQGEDRVIQIEPGSAYAMEPVHLGEAITLRFTIRRTALGATCRVESGVAIFKDIRSIPMPGTILTPLQQFSTDWVSAQTEIEPPKGLFPGRVRVEIQLQYRCGGAIVSDRVPPIPFTLLKGAP